MRLLSSLEEKEELVKRIGIDHFIVLPFTQAFSLLTAEEFIRTILVDRLNIRHLTLGYDHHIGRGGQTNYEQISEICQVCGIGTERVGADQWKGITISSSKIRESLEAGSLQLANDLLGYAYQLSGCVVHGKKFGRKLGFPTANIVPSEPLKLVPPAGVYAVHALVRGQSHRAMLYIGHRPTVNSTPQAVVEVNLFDFNGDDLYDEMVSVTFEHYLRGDVRFPNVEELRQQIARDQLNTLKLLG